MPPKPKPQTTAAPSPTEAIEPIDQRILDATRELVGENGTRLTIDDVAERARVARATVFRRFGTKEAVLDRMFAREAELVFAELAAIADAADGPRRGLVAMLARILELSQTHPIAHRFLRVEPRAVTDLLNRGEPSTIARARSDFAERIYAALPRGARSRRRALEIGDIIVHLIAGYGFVPGAVVDLLDKGTREALAADVVAGLVPER